MAVSNLVDSSRTQKKAQAAHIRAAMDTDAEKSWEDFAGSADRDQLPAPQISSE